MVPESSPTMPMRPPTKLFAHAGGGVSAEFEAAAGGDGGGIVGEALGVGGLGCDWRWASSLAAFDPVDVGLLGGGESGFGAFVCCGGLGADEAFGPVFVEVGVHLVLAVEALEGGGFGGGVGFRVVLRDLVGGEAVGGHDPRLSGRVRAAVVTVELDAVDVGVEVGEDGDLAGEGVGGVGAFDLGFDALDGGQVVGVVGAGGLREHAAGGEAQESREKDESGME